MVWIRPTNHTGTGEEWTSPTNAYDADVDTYANEIISGRGNSDWMYLGVSSVECDKITIKHRYSLLHSDGSYTYPKLASLQVLSGSYTEITSQVSVPGSASYQTFYLPSISTITGIRFRYYNPNSVAKFHFYLYDVKINRRAIPTVTTDASPTENDHNSATLGGNVTADNDEDITERGIEYKIGSDGEPDRVSETDDDFGTGVFTLRVTNLSIATEYYYRAYAINDTGIGYGDWKSFTTDATTPTVATLTCTDIGSTSVTANGNIINKGGADVLTRGFCYKEGTTGDPTTADDTQSEGAGAGDYDTGEYSLSITGLTPSTSYRIRAYAVNSEGIAYGDTIDVTGYTFTEGADTYFENFYDKCYIVNGEDDMVKYDGDLVSTVGITPPSAAPTGVAGGADGSLGTGDYVYAYTYVDKDGYESNASASSAAVTVGAGEKVTLTIANSPDPKVVAKNIYRSQIDDTVLYYEGQVADNTTTTFTSSIADTALGSLLHTDHDAPPERCHLIAKRLNRIILASDDEIAISQLSDVEYFPPAFFQQTGFRQKITGMIQQTNALPVFTENSIERLLGTDEDNFEFKNAYSRKGSYAPRSVVSCDNLVVYLGFDGIYYFDGETTGIFNYKLNRYIQDNMNYEYIDKSAATYYKGRYWLSYPKGTSTVNSETVYIDLINKTTGVFDFAFSCYSRWERFGDGNRLFGGSVSEGTVYEIDNNVTIDDISPIACYDKTDFMDFGYPERWKQFYHIYIKVKSTTATTLTFYYTLDDNDETSQDISIDADTTKWYKIDLEGGGQRGRAIQLRPYVYDVSDITFCGYEVVFTMEAEEYS